MISKLFRKSKQLTCKHKIMYDSTTELWKCDELLEVEYNYLCVKCGKLIRIKSNNLMPEAVLQNKYRKASKIVKKRRSND